MVDLNTAILVKEPKDLDGLHRHQRICYACKNCGKSVDRIYFGRSRKSIERLLCTRCATLDTLKTRYGVTNVMHIPEVVAKLQNTCLERYGSVCSLNGPEQVQKKIQTWKEHYGVTNPYQSEENRYKRSKYHYKGIGFDSSWELAFYIYHKDQGHEIEREPCSWEYKFEGQTYTVVPDFSVDGVIYEIKSDHLLKENAIFDSHEVEHRKFALEFERSKGVQIIIGNEIAPYLDWVRKNYGKQYLSKFRHKIKGKFKEYKMQLKPIITSLLDQDLYKFSMGQLYFHQHNGLQAEWAFKCRNENVVFTIEEVNEINKQIDHYCSLRFSEEELTELHKKCIWLHLDYLDFLRFWHPRREDIIVDDQSPCGLRVRIKGSAVNVSPYETPIMAIITETHYRMSGHYHEMFDEFKVKTEQMIKDLKKAKYQLGCFSEFGFRRRLSYEAQDYFVKRFMEENMKECGFIGTSDVHFAIKYDTMAVGSVGHEAIMLCGQAYPHQNPAYSNKFFMDSWVKEYGVLNGIALTDTIGTDMFLKDFRRTFATLFSGVRHDSGDPYAWAEKMLQKYKDYNIDPKTKTLLFSDSLDLERAHKLYQTYKDRCKVAFGIGTYLVGPAKDALNIVIKPVRFNGLPVAKLSDAPGKNMCEDQSYIDYLRRTCSWRSEHAEQIQN